MSQTAHTLTMMSKSNNPSSKNSKSTYQKTMTSQTIYQNTMTSQMHLDSNITLSKRHNSNDQTNIPTDVTENHKLSHNPNTILENRLDKTGRKADTHCISPSDIIPNLR